MPKYYHYFRAGIATKPPILMLHGTGGYEDELAPLAQQLAPDSPLLGIRGRLTEQGRTRYFAHTADGRFDLTSLANETTWLMTAIDELAAKYKLAVARMIVVGYSNGANIATHAWLTQQAKFKTGILFHPMQLTDYQPIPTLNEIKVWASYGSLDPIVTATNFAALTQTLTTAHADLTVFKAEQSHALSPQELAAAKKWLQTSQGL